MSKMESEISKQCLKSFVKIPKLELHAHLNGSLSQNTIKKLIDLKKSKTSHCSVLDFNEVDFTSNNLSECFKLFALIHDLTDTPEAIYMATCDVIRDFYGDGTYYLELRTTPKAVGNMTQESYVDTVLKAINTTVAELQNEMHVKLILSIDRKRPQSSAEETIKIAEKYFTSSQSVVGIDLSGDPTVGNISTFISFLEYSKRIGLKLAFHVAEVSQFLLYFVKCLTIFLVHFLNLLNIYFSLLVPNMNEEVKQLLKLQPHRLGHGTFLHPNRGGSVENLNLLKELKVPLEICLTSNVICKTVPSYEEHHFQLFRKMNYPCTLCTDDQGIFNTSLSKEYYLASKYYSLSDTDLYDLSYNSIDYIFSPNSKKQELKKLWTLKRNQPV